LTDVGEQDAQSADAGENPASFLADLGNELRKKEDIDFALAEILAHHLLTDTPAPDAVAKAKDLILNLAGKRAMSKPETDDA
jgi:hypothetical protein